MARPLPARAAILQLLSGPSRGMHPRELAARLEVPEEEFARFLEHLDELCFAGAIRRLPGSRFAASIAKPDVERWVGQLNVNPRGFGFVTVAGKDDVYVQADALGGALHGDQVQVSVLARTSRGVEGVVEAVTERRSPRVAGTLRKRGKSAWLEPDDTRIRGPIVIQRGADGAADGVAAVVAITRFPEFPSENPEGELVATLGVPGEANAEVAKILIRAEVRETHPEAAIQEAESMAARVRRVRPEKRVDLTNIPLPSIDPEDARDHDDAVWVERQGSGYRAWIAIADVAEYVQAGSALDEEARARGCTIYLPDRAIPMLPSALAADLCSLLPDVQRLCLCVIADLDRMGKVKSFEIVEGVMRSAAMLTYGGVARALGFLSDDGPKSAQAEGMVDKLRVVDELARKLRKARMRRGALDMNLPEAHVLLNPEDGSPDGVERRAQDEGMKRAYQIVEELMLLANELVAQWLSKRGAPTIYRVHATPDEKKLQRLAELCEVLGVEAYVEDLMDPSGIGEWLASIAGHPYRGVLESMLLRSLKQATYDVVNIGHFGLASDAYLHFTSPIRRYPDLEVHRAVKALLRGGKVDDSEAAVEELRVRASHSSKRERAAAEVEREVVDLYRAVLMRDRIGDSFEGTVTGVSGAGLFVSLDDPFVDVLVRFESLGQDSYQLDEHEMGAVGLRSGDRVTIGARMTLAIEDVSIIRRTVYGKREVDSVDEGEPTRKPTRSRGPKGALRLGRPVPLPTKRVGRSDRDAPPARSTATPGAPRRATGPEPAPQRSQRTPEPTAAPRPRAETPVVPLAKLPPRRVKARTTSEGKTVKAKARARPLLSASLKGRTKPATKSSSAKPKLRARKKK